MVLSYIKGEENKAKKVSILIDYHQLELGLRMLIFDEKVHGHLDLLTNTCLVLAIKRVMERNLPIQINGKCKWLGANPIIIECVLESYTGWEDKQKMSLYRMVQKLMYRENLYNLKGKKKQRREETGGKTTLMLPKNIVPRTLDTWRDEKILEIFPERILGMMEIN